jgi:hypothetical protein
MKPMRRTNFLWAAVLLALSIFILAQALGYVPPGVWDAALRAAPALLVFAGLMLVLRGRVPFGGLISIVLSVALVAIIGGSAFATRAGQLRDDQVVPIVQSVAEDVTLLRVVVETLATDVSMEPAAARADGIRGQFAGSLASAVDVQYVEAADNSATLTIRETQPGGLPSLEQIGRGTLELTLPPGIPIDIQLAAAQGASALSLDGLNLERLNASVQQGDLVITMPDYLPTLVTASEQNGELAALNGSLTVVLPRSVPARFELNRGGADPIYDPAVFNFLVGDVLESRDILQAETVLRYVLTAPRGQIRVESTP